MGKHALTFMTCVNGGRLVRLGSEQISEGAALDEIPATMRNECSNLSTASESR